MFKKLLNYLNPFASLGKVKSGSMFPLIFMILWTVGLEFYGQVIIKNPAAVGLPAIILNLVYIVYFSFRNGIKGGFIVTVITLLYYAYLVYSRHYEGQRLQNSINTTIALGVVYFIISGVIGWLKQTIDNLIHKEREARINAENAKTRLQSIMEQLPVGVMVTDKDGTLDLTNKQLEKIAGGKMKSFTLGKPHTYQRDKSISTENGKPLTDEDWPLMQTFMTGKPVSKFISVQREDGKQYHLQISSSLIKNKKKEVIAAAAIINDITEQKEIEERKDDFINMASHELKTPLTSTKLFIKSFERHLDNQKDEKGGQLLSKIDKQIKKLSLLVKEMLDVTNINKGGLRMNEEKFEIRDVIKEVVGDLQAITDHDIILDGQTDKVVLGDREKIMQVLSNLITNAIKYSDPGKKIVISSKTEDDKVIINVQDFGIGISKSQQEKIFGRFYQAHGLESATYPGLGLGLFIASQIIDLHKGKIWVESEKGKGSTFYFSLPLAPQNLKEKKKNNL